MGETMNRNLIIGVAVLAALIIVPQSPLSVTGTSQIEYTSNGDFFNGEFLTINYVGDQNTEEINAFLSSDDIQSETGENIEQSIEIEASNTETKAQYSFQDAGLRDLYYIEAIKSDNTFTDTFQMNDWASQNCADIDGDGSVNQGSDFVTKDVLFSGERPYCVRVSNILGNVGDISTPQPVFSTQFTVTPESKSSSTCTISNTDVGAGATSQCGENVLISWSGSNSLANAPVADDELILQSNDFQDNFRVVREAEYRNWEQQLSSSNGLIDEIEGWKNGELSETDVNDINNEAVDAYYEFSTSPLADGSLDGSTIDGGLLNLYTNHELLWPEFSIYVKGGDYIQVTKEVGEPQITSTSATEISEIGGGTLDATVENVGSGDGVFDARISSCTTGFNPESTTKQLSVNQGGSSNVEFNVAFSSGSSQQEESGSCVVEVSNSDDSATVTESVDVTGVQENECQAGNRFETVVDGQTAVQQCDSNGFPGEIVDVCGDDPVETGDTTVENGDLVCEEEGDTTGGGISFPTLDFGIGDIFGDRSDNLFGGGALGTVGAVFDVLLSVLAGLYAFNFGTQIIGKPTASLVEQATGVGEAMIQVLIGAAIGLLVMALVYMLISNLLVKILLVVGIALGAYLFSTIFGAAGTIQLLLGGGN